MNGLQRFFLRITPIIMLICFVCFGITHTFSTTQQPFQENITYLTKEVITIDDKNTITTEDDLTIDNYSFDFKSYRENINIDILKRATTNVIDIETYTSVLNNFNKIWQDGYQFGDGIQTIINALILVVNTLILPINVLIAPLRIVAGILLTAFSIVGININRNSAIINTLNTILDELAIPLIRPTFNKENINYMVGEVWRFNATITEPGDLDSTFEYTFIDKTGTQYHAIKIYKQGIGNNTKYIVEFQQDGGTWVKVYENYWLADSYRTITITNVPNQNGKKQSIYAFMNYYATKLEVQNLENTIWTFNTTLDYTGITELTFYFESNNTEYSQLYFSRVLVKYDNNSYYNTYGGISAWSDEAYRTIYITYTSDMSTADLALLTEILTNNATQIT